VTHCDTTLAESLINLRKGFGVDLTVPGLKFFTFWSRKSDGATIAAQNGCLATISELALAARAPDKTYHHCVLLGHSFGGLVLENTISHSILDASSNGSRNTSPWDMAVAFNAADSSIGRRQLMSELDYLYKSTPNGMPTWVDLLGLNRAASWTKTVRF
jgi:hypothetical protein